MDADTFGWDKYDPCYLPLMEGTYDTVVCTYVLSAVSKMVAESIVEDILKVLTHEGIGYFVVPRNLPKEGKLSGHARRPQSNVLIKGATSMYEVIKKFEIYAATSACDIRLSGFCQHS
jgi:hypothetical protein